MDTQQLEIYLQSKYASYVVNGTGKNSDLVFFLRDPVVCPRGRKMRYRVQNFIFPLSFYLVDDNNNSLVIDSTTYTLTNGNYTASTLRDLLDGILPETYTVTYSTTTNKYTFSNTSGDFTISSASTCLILLGFTEDEDHTSSSNSLTSDSVANLTGQYNCVYIQISNLTTSNIGVDGAKTTVCKSIPVSETLGSIMYYQDNTAVYSNIFNESVSFLHIRILAEDMRTPVDFQGQQWNMCLEFSFLKDENADVTFSDVVNQIRNP